MSELAVPDPVDRTYRRRDSLEGRLSASPASSQRKRKSKSSTLGRNRLTEDVVPPPEDASPSDRTEGPAEDEEKIPEDEAPRERYSARLLNEAYTISWLIFFSILGTLARLGTEALTKYPNAPISSTVLWANLGGSLTLGFLTQDRRIFREEWGEFDSESYSFTPTHSDSSSQRNRAYANHAKVKKTIPLFIGLATGFCGCFTSFSSFMRDAFLALTNALPSPSPGYPIQAPSPTTLHPRSGGYSFLALTALLILHPAVSLTAYRTGAHLALALDPVMPILPFRIIHRILDPLALLLGTGILARRHPPHRPPTHAPHRLATARDVQPDLRAARLSPPLLRVQAPQLTHPFISPRHFFREYPRHRRVGHVLRPTARVCGRGHGK